MVPARIDAIWNGDLQALASIVDIGKSSYPWLNAPRLVVQ